MADADQEQPITRPHGNTRRCNGRRISRYRRSLKLTQQELAQRTGYSERLIRKAESNGSVMTVVLRDLAVALSTEDRPLVAADITADAERYSREILNALCRRHGGWMEDVGELLADDARLYCVGDADRIPFAGWWHGRDGFAEWAKIFCATASKPEQPTRQPEFLADEDQTVIWGVEIWQNQLSTDKKPVWMTMRLQYDRGELTLLEVLFDTYEARKFLQIPTNVPVSFPAADAAHASNTASESWSADTKGDGVS
ncbi:MAG: helix-turn-helix transcriptional regulator [Planctomycetales bacterium]|nr:helix-turn-helix transcriptional regulator [Planctomycetales bacterium]